jgi:hypothetical protein
VDLRGGTRLDPHYISMKDLMLYWGLQKELEHARPLAIGLGLAQGHCRPCSYFVPKISEKQEVTACRALGAPASCRHFRSHVLQVGRMAKRVMGSKWSVLPGVRFLWNSSVNAGRMPVRIAGVLS